MKTTKSVIKLDFETYKDKVEACWIGKNIGGTMGGPYEHSRSILDVKGFTTDAGEPLPNDDLDLQLVWLHALENVGPYNITSSTLGEFWLSFITPHWNEYGIAKANMKRGLIPPLAGDYDNSWCNSNGAWIRTEIWACVAPGIPALAAKYASEDAKVDHGAGEGTISSAFVAALQSSAFVISDLKSCIKIALEAIPAQSRTAQSIRLVQVYYDSGKSWVEARNAVLNQNSDIGTGWFEAPSNVAYSVIGLLYGEGDFKKSMLTAINCGDDTDCTAATVGATLGILYGTAGVPTDWREYIGDKIITISLSCGSVGKSFPNTCKQLSSRVVAIAPSVIRYHNVRVNPKRKYTVEFGKQDIPTNAEELLAETVKSEMRLTLENLCPYSMHFEHEFLIADVTLSDTEIKPLQEINLHIDFAVNLAFENQPYTANMRWILPDGFSVEGKKSLFIPGWDIHSDSTAKYDFILKAGEHVESENRIILEITPHGRHTAMYISFLLLG